MSNQPATDAHRRAAKSSIRPPLVAKGARKRFAVEESDSESSSSNRPSASGGSRKTDSGVDRRGSTQVKVAAAGHQRPALAAKSSKKVAFRVEDDSESEGGARHAGPSQHRGHHNLPANSEAFFAQASGQRRQESTQSDRNKAQKSRVPISNPLDRLNQKPTKSAPRRNLGRTELISWTGKYARKEFEGGSKRSSRMTIGGTGSSRSSRISVIARTGEKDRGWYVSNGTVVSLSGRGASESSSASDIEDLYGSPPPRPVVAKAARKLQIGVKTVRQPSSPQQSEHDSEMDIGFEDHDNQAQDGPDNAIKGSQSAKIDPPLNATSPSHMVDGASSDSDSTAEPADSESDHEELTLPPDALVEALGQITLASVRLRKMKRLPFLLRNLRLGFIFRCQMAGIDVERKPPPKSISVLYSRQPEATSPRLTKTPTPSTKTSMKDWLCPLCDLHEKFANHIVLGTHLAWDHPTVKALWNEDHSTLALNVPSPVPQKPVPKLLAYRLPIREPSETTSDFSSNAPANSTRENSVSDQKSFDRASTTTSTTATETTLVTTITSNTEEDIKPKWAPSRYLSQTVSDVDRRSTSVSGQSGSQGPAGRSSSRVSQEALGPSATSPYLPESKDGDVYYSCRPGGPRLYDIMNTLSLEPYGVLKWVVVDREEELFELDDVLDEDKVIQALWYRWIFLNRNKFVANYFNGTKSFITENWQMIQKGAGLLALRTWLLVLCVNNFLTALEVVTLMRYYQELAGIQLR